MKRVLWILFIATILGIGCSPEEELENESSDSRWIRTPPSIGIGDFDEQIESFARLDKFCWETNAEEPCDLTPIDPQDVVEKERQKGGRTEFIIHVTPGEKHGFHYTPAEDQPLIQMKLRSLNFITMKILE